MTWVLSELQINAKTSGITLGKISRKCGIMNRTHQVKDRVFGP
jgi:hypothetical protein